MDLLPTALDVFYIAKAFMLEQNMLDIMKSVGLGFTKKSVPTQRPLIQKKNSALRSSTNQWLLRKK